jgi:hypothetical protein
LDADESVMPEVDAYATKPSKDPAMLEAGLEVRM